MWCEMVPALANWQTGNPWQTPATARTHRLGSEFTLWNFAWIWFPWVHHHSQLRTGMYKTCKIKVKNVFTVSSSINKYNVTTLKKELAFADKLYSVDNLASSHGSSLKCAGVYELSYLGWQPQSSAQWVSAAPPVSISPCSTQDSPGPAPTSSHPRTWPWTSSWRPLGPRSLATRRRSPPARATSPPSCAWPRPRPRR